MNRFRTFALGIAAASLMIGGCANGNLHGDTEKPMQHARIFSNIDEAVAVLRPTEGNNAQGTVHFYQEGEQVRVVAEVQGLNPNQQHGFHIHEFGDTTAADGTAAGGHYNPEGHPHARPNGTVRHAGDLGNLQANAEGVARAEITVDNITIAGMENPILGRGVIVHAKPDDGGQPTGNAGARIAQGVIGVVK